jgi:hypothetical protein
MRMITAGSKYGEGGALADAMALLPGSVSEG